MIEPATLAAYIASRICHDLVSPVSSVTNALDLMNEPGDDEMKEQASQLLSDGAAKAAASLQFLRYAFGSIGLSSGAADIHQAKTITEDFVKSHRPSLEWDLQTSNLTYSHARLMMNLVMMMVDCLPRGGVINVRIRDEAGGMTIVLTGAGQRAKLKESIVKALESSEPEDGWAPDSIQPYFTKMISDGLGAELSANHNEDQIIIMATGIRAEG